MNTTIDTRAAMPQIPITQQEKRVEVICDLCGQTDEGLIKDLQRKGWEVTKREAFCPNHD